MPKYGMFKELEDIIRRDNPREFPKLFGRLRKAPNNEVRYKIMKKHPHGVTVLLHKMEKPSKDEKASEDARIIGNAAFKDKDYLAAGKKYTESLLNAVASKRLAVIYANRSAANFRLMKYADSLKDVDRAFLHGYKEVHPDKAKLLDERKGRCLDELGQASEAIVEYEKALKQYECEMSDKCDELKDKIATCKNNLSSRPKAAHNATSLKESIDDMKYLSTEVRDKIKIHIDSQEQCENLGSEDQLNSQKIERETVFKEGPHAVYQHLSAACEVQHTPTKGRYLVANQVINPGDPIIVESPYATVINKESILTHCHHCLAKLSSPVPCKTCSVVLFCDEQCREKASDYHKIECPTINHLMEDCIGKCTVTHLAFKTILIAGLKTILRYHDCILNKSNIMNSDLPKDLKDYHMLNQQVTHLDSSTDEDVYERTLLSVFLMRCLKEGKFFPTFPSDEDEYFIGGQILNLLQSLPFYGCVISDMASQLSDNTTGVSGKGGAIYLTEGLLNHSCWPNTFKSDKSSRDLVVRAIVTINPGQEITDSYGVWYPKHTTWSRRASLKRKYRFECQCEACTEDWPLTPDDHITAVNDNDHTDPRHTIWKCTSCCKAIGKLEGAVEMIRCSHRSCSALNNIDMARSNILGSHARNYAPSIPVLHSVYVKPKDAEEILQKLWNHLSILEQYVCHPNWAVSDCRESIKECYLRLNSLYYVEGQRVEIDPLEPMYKTMIPKLGAHK